MVTLCFHIPFIPRGGERLFLSWVAGANEGHRPMEYDKGHGYWHTTLNVSADGDFRWHYRLQLPSGKEEQEGAPDRELKLSPKCKGSSLHLVDFWRPPGDLLGVFSRAPFRDVFFPRPPRDVTTLDGDEPPQAIFRVPAPTILPTERLYLTGEPDMLGAWSPERSLPLHPSAYPYWEIRIAHSLPTQFSYKYLIKMKNGKNIHGKGVITAVFTLPPRG